MWGFSVIYSQLANAGETISNLPSQIEFAVVQRLVLFAYFIL